MVTCSINTISFNFGGITASPSPSGSGMSHYPSSCSGQRRGKRRSSISHKPAVHHTPDVCPRSSIPLLVVPHSLESVGREGQPRCPQPCGRCRLAVGVSASISGPRPGARGPDGLQPLLLSSPFCKAPVVSCLVSPALARWSVSPTPCHNIINALERPAIFCILCVWYALTSSQQCHRGCSLQTRHCLFLSLQRSLSECKSSLLFFLSIDGSGTERTSSL